MSELLSRVRALIYLYFDALDYKLSSELANKTDILLLNGRKMSYDDVVKILQLKDKIEIIEKIERELYEVLDTINES